MPCHETCSACSGPLGIDCTSCLYSAFLDLDSTCIEKCRSNTYPDEEKKCQKCHDSCFMCAGPTEYNCTDCGEKPYLIKSADGRCVDCLNNKESDPTTCKINVDLTIKVHTGKFANIKASLSLQVSFFEENNYLSRLTADHYQNNLEIEIEGINTKDFLYKFEIRSNQVMLDVYFLTEERRTSLITLTPKNELILINVRTKKSELIWKKRPCSTEIFVSKAPDSEALTSLQNAFGRSDKILNGAGAASPLIAVFAILTAGGIGEPLMKLFKIFKLASRLRLINVDFGVFLEIFLVACNSMFKIGGDKMDKLTFYANPSTRGKLDKYDVTVIAAAAVPLQFAIYWIMLAVRVYRSKIRRYIKKVEKLKPSDKLVNIVAENFRVMLFTLIGIDVFFYSIRCISHMKYRAEDDRNLNYFFSYWVSLITVCVIPTDFAILLVSNKACLFPYLRLMKRKERLIVGLGKNEPFSIIQPSRSKKGSEVLKQKDSEPQNSIMKNESANKIGNEEPKNKSPSDSNQLDVYLNQNLKAKKNSLLRSRYSRKDPKMQKEEDLDSSEFGLKKQTIKLESEDKLDKEKNLSEEEKSSIPLDRTYYFTRKQLPNPPLEQFYGNGIKLHMLRISKNARYFNSISLIKLFVFEPLYVTLQLFPTIQIGSFLVIQIVFCVWLVIIGFKYRIFSSKVMFASILTVELAFTIFILVGFVFKVGGGENRFSPQTRKFLQFLAMGAMALSCVVGLIEVIVCLVLLPINYFKSRKIQKHEEEAKKRKEEKKDRRLNKSEPTDKIKDELKGEGTEKNLFEGEEPPEKLVNDGPGNINDPPELIQKFQKRNRMNRKLVRPIQPKIEAK